MSLLTDLRAFKAALNPLDIRSAWSAFKSIGDTIIGLTTAVGASDDTSEQLSDADKAECKQLCEECAAELNVVSADGVGKLGDGKLKELFKQLLPLLIAIL